MPEMPDPAKAWYVDGIIRDGRWIIMYCPFCANPHYHELGPSPVEEIREAPCRKGASERAYYYVRNAEVGYLPGLLSVKGD